MLGIRERSHRLGARIERGARRAGMPVCAAAVMAAMTAATAGALPPAFGAACFAAGLYAGRKPLWMLLGCLLGCDWLRLGWRAGLPFAGCLLIWGLAVLWEARLPPAGKDVKAAALAGLGALIPPLVLCGGDWGLVALCAASGALALATAPVFRGALALRAHRRRLTPDERLSLLLVSLVALWGAGARAPFAAAVVARFATLSLAHLGGEWGAAAGLLWGAALSFLRGGGGGSPSLGLMGLAAGAARPLGRFWMALVFALGGVADYALGGGELWGAHSPLAAVLAAGLYLAVPASALDRLAGWARPLPPHRAPEEVTERVARDTGRRLRALAGVYGEMAEGYGQVSDGPDEKALLFQMRRRLCAGCPGYEGCWTGGEDRAGRFLCGLLSDALRGHPLKADEPLPPQAARVCRRAPLIPARLGALLTEFDKTRRVNAQKKTASALLARHFSQAKSLLLDLDGRLASILTVDEALGRSGMAALERTGLDAEDVLALTGEATEICVTLRDQPWTRERAEAAAQALSKAARAPMRPARGFDKAQFAPLRFFESPPLSVAVGYAARAREKDAPSGDSHLAAGLPGGRVLLALSDGMGSGETAARESADALRMIRRFLMAGVEESLMLDAVNHLLMLKGGEDMYATADLCVLDLSGAKCRFTKLGACASYILRRGKCLRVEGGRLPLGILDRVTPAGGECDLMPGDTIVLVTDGVADTTSPEASTWLEGQLLALKNESPGDLCARLLERAAARKHAQTDDMTALAARIGRAV